MWREQAEAEPGQPGAGNTDQLGDPAGLELEEPLLSGFQLEKRGSGPIETSSAQSDSIRCQSSSLGVAGTPSYRTCVRWQAGRGHPYPPRVTETPDLSTTSGDRLLNVWLSGDPNGRALVFHPGTPGPPTRWKAFDDAAERHGLRVITYARPGYSGSTRHQGRSVADAAADTAAVLDALDVEDFLTLGHSGGGPHALACGALLPLRCRAVAALASVAPYDVGDLDWLDGMADENVVEFGKTLLGENEYRSFLEEEIAIYANVKADEVADALRGLVPDVDKAVLTGEMAEMSVTTFRQVARDGLEGWLDDGLAFVQPWGFDLTSMTVPVAIWQGRHDRMVPYSHGEWLATHIPTARPHLLEDDGHLTLLTNRLDEILVEALHLAGRPAA